MPATKKVTLARAYTDAEGAAHKADATVELPRHEANRLLADGLAREPKPPTSDRAEDVLATVGDDKVAAAAALEAEQAKGGKARKTLVEKLQAIIEKEN